MEGTRVPHGEKQVKNTTFRREKEKTEIKQNEMNSSIIHSFLLLFFLFLFAKLTKYELLFFFLYFYELLSKINADFLFLWKVDELFVLPLSLTVSLKFCSVDKLLWMLDLKFDLLEREHFVMTMATSSQSHEDSNQ